MLNTLPPLPRWLHAGGPDDDVVLVTRLSLSRNSADFCFPPAMDSGERIELLRLCEDAVRELHGNYLSYELQSLSPVERLLFREQLYLPPIPSEDESQSAQRLVIREGGAGSILINYDDHFRMQEICAGFELNKLYGWLEKTDSILERHFNYAVSLDMGYLRSDIAKCGDGLGADVLLHLPALSRTDNFDEVIAHAQREGLRLSRFEDASGGSIAQVYLLSIDGGLGYREAELLEKLALVVIEFIHYEREARRSLAETGGLEYADMLWRDFATLSFCRLLGFPESMELYSRVRSGQSLGILPQRDTGPSLFFLSQPGHLHYLLSSEQSVLSSESAQALDEFRAEVFRERLGDS